MKMAARAGTGESPEAIVKAMSDRATVVVVLDDAQHLDEVSMERLGRLGAALAGCPVVMLASFRTDAAGNGSTAAIFISLLGAQRLVLRGLDLDAMKRLAHDRLGLSIDPDYAASLHEKTAGNPGHFLALLSRAPLRVTATLPETGIEPLARQAQEMLDGIESAERRAVHLLALIEKPFVAGLAQAALGGSVADSEGRSQALACLLHKMEERGLLARLEEPDAWAFPSAAMREAAARATRKAIHEEDVASAHRGIATWLEAHAHEGDAAWHYERSGHGDDAVRCLERAGAQEDLPVAARIAVLQRLETKLEADPSASRARLAKCIIDRGALVRGQSSAEGMALLQRGFALAELSRDANTRVLARCELAKGLQHSDATLARSLVDEAVALLPSPETDDAHWHRAYALSLRGHLLLRQAQQGDEKAEQMKQNGEHAWIEAEHHLCAMRGRQDTKLRSMLAAARGTQRYREHALDEAREQFALSIALAEEGGHAQLISLASGNLFLLMSEGIGAVDEAHALFRRARAQLEKLSDPSALANLHRNYAVTLMERTSDWKDVATSYETATQLSRALSRPSEVRLDLLNLSEVKLLQGACDDVGGLLEEVARIEVDLPHLEARHLLPFRLGLWHLTRTGADPAAACEDLREALALSDATGHQVERSSLEATYALALARARGGLDAEGEGLLRSAFTRAGDRQGNVRARVHRLWGECLLEPTVPLADEPRYAEAVSHFEETLRLALEARYGIEEAYARSYLGRLLGDDVAREHLRRARELKARLNAVSLPGERLDPV